MLLPYMPQLGPLRQAPPLTLPLFPKVTALFHSSLAHGPAYVRWSTTMEMIEN